MLQYMLKNTEVANDIAKIRNDYVTNASVDSKINDLKAKHTSDEVKKVDDKVNKNASNILKFESKISFSRGFFSLHRTKLFSL